MGHAAPSTTGPGSPEAPTIQLRARLHQYPTIQTRHGDAKPSEGRAAGFTAGLGLLTGCHGTRRRLSPDGFSSGLAGRCFDQTHVSRLGEDELMVPSGLPSSWPERDHPAFATSSESGAEPGARAPLPRAALGHFSSKEQLWVSIGFPEVADPGEAAALSQADADEAVFPGRCPLPGRRRPWDPSSCYIAAVKRPGFCLVHFTGLCLEVLTARVGSSDDIGRSGREAAGGPLPELPFSSGAVTGLTPGLGLQLRHRTGIPEIWVQILA